MKRPRGVVAVAAMIAAILAACAVYEPTAGCGFAVPSYCLAPGYYTPPTYYGIPQYPSVRWAGRPHHHDGDHDRPRR